MTDKKPYLASLKGRGLDGTGVTETTARQMTNSKGRRYMAVVEVEVHTIHDKPEQLIADLAVEQFWAVIDDTDLDNLLRDTAAILYARRGNPNGDQELDLDGPSPKVSDVLARGRALKPHPYISSGLSLDDNADCDVCGQHETADQHRTEQPADEPDDPETGEETDGGEQSETPRYPDEPWEYDGPEGTTPQPDDELQHNHGPDTECPTDCPVLAEADRLLADA